MRPEGRARVSFATSIALTIVALTLAVAWRAAARAAPAAQGMPSGWAVERIIPVADGELLDLATTADGGAWLVLAPYAPQSDYAALRRVDDAGSLQRSHVLRDADGRWLQPLAVAPAGDGGAYVASADTLLAVDAAGDALWHAPAGDGHPDFGPAARALAGPAGDGLLYGLDLANARVLGYGAGTGALRRRLGTSGVSPGSYLAPRDIAIVPDGAAELSNGQDPAGRLWVADFGNRRLQQLDAMGNPVARLPLAHRPVALTVAADGGLLVALENDELVALSPDGGEDARFGGHGDGPERLHTVAALSMAPDGRLWIADRGNGRVVVYRPPGLAPPPGLTPPAPGATPTMPGTATIPSPTSIVSSACPGRPVTLSWTVDLPAAPQRADVLLAFDTTGSMEGVVSVARAKAGELASALGAVVPDAAIAVLDVRDYPYGEAGAPTDLPWRLRGRLRPAQDIDAHQRALDALRAGGGGDAPEAYAGALSAALDDERIGWRADARRILVLVGDSVPRDDDLNEGISNPPVPGIWTPGRPRWWRDAGPDWAPGSGDDLDWQAFLDRLAAEEVTLLAAISGAAPVELGGSRADLSAYWQAWTARTPGGSAQELDTVAALPERLAEQVAGVGRTVRRLGPAARPVPQAAWVVFDPSGFDDLTVPAAGRRLDFSVTISPPPDTPPGDYPLVLTLHADGGLVAQRSVRLRWTAPCPGTATPTVEATPTPRISATPTRSATSTATPEPPSATPSPSASPTPFATAAPSSTATPTRTPVVDDGPRRLWLPVAYRRYCDPKARPRVDVALVLDTSSSMAGAKLAAARDAAVGFLGLLALPRDHAAVLTFDEQARLRQWLTGERPLLELALLGLRSAPGTRIDLGIEGARRELLGPRGRAIGAGGDDGRTVAAIVLLTDGRPDAGGEADTLAAAARARQAGIELFTIGLGASADAALLERLAGDPARHYRAGGAEELAAIYGRIAGDIGCR